MALTCAFVAYNEDKVRLISHKLICSVYFNHALKAGLDELI